MITDLRPRGSGTEAVLGLEQSPHAHQVHSRREREDKEAETSAKDRKEQLAGVLSRPRERRGQV